MKQVKTTAIALFFLSLAMICLTGCSFNELKNRDPDAKVAFLHHSTGIYVFKGERHGLSKYTTRLGPSLVTDLFRQYNKDNNTKYSIKARKFPSGDPYPWNNYPYDYYNIWVNNAGENT